MWNDRETDRDLIGHLNLARTIAALIREPSLSPLTIGVYGDWGAGKSSILRLVENELRGDQKTCCLLFNGWLFQGYEDTKSVLMQAIITELEKHQPTNEVLKKKAKELLKRVDWLKLARRGAGLAWTALTGTPDPLTIASIIERLKSFVEKPPEGISREQAEGVARAVQDSIKEVQPATVPEEISAFRKEFEELLETAKVDRLVVLVDDLDRCLPSTAIDTLEAIRLFFYVPGTVFVLAADEQMIAYAVRRHFPELPVSVGQTDYTRNYLEKLIQVPFRVPPLGKPETRAYVTLLLAEHALREKPESIEKLRELAQDTFARPWEGKRLDESAIKATLGSVPGELQSALLMADRISPALAEGLRGNPRQVKRFLNTLMVRLRVATAYGIADLIDPHALAKLMLLERFSEHVYTEIVGFMAKSEAGRVSELQAIELLATKEETGPRGPKGKTQTPGCPASWLDDEWLRAWTKIEPRLGELDLRPYVFVSREKTPGFTTEVLLGAALEKIAGRLASGQPLMRAALGEELKALNAGDAQKLFNHLADRSRQAPDWKTKPKELDGLYELCKHHPQLQQELVGVFESLPVRELGAWAATGMKAVLTDQTARDRFQRLMGQWQKQQENQILRKAVEQLGGI